MSKWTHSICGNCYAKHEPGREPVRIKEEYRDEVVVCCFCGKDTDEGIFYRYNPRKTLCGGDHGDL